MDSRIGPFQVLAEVARGGMGAVFRARGPDGREVALKLLLAGREATPAQRRRFALEAEALRRIEHPNVVALLGSGEHEGTPYLVLEWVAGAPLSRRLEQRGPFDPREAAELVARLARALAHCHERGVLHRDLKPENVIARAESGAPVLVDFGLARTLVEDGAVTRATRTGQFLGSPGWWAPEQARGDTTAIGPRTDVYGLGALLYGLLTGRPVHQGESLVQVLEAAERDPVPPSRLSPRVPARLEAVCLRCLARDPGARWPGPMVVAVALGDALPGRRERAPIGTALVAGAVAIAALGAAVVAMPSGSGVAPVSSSAAFDPASLWRRHAALAEADPSLARRPTEPIQALWPVQRRLRGPTWRGWSPRWSGRTGTRRASWRRA